MTDFTKREVQSMLLWGAIGGMLPTLSRIAGTFGADFNAPMPALVGVAIALGVYGVIGCIIARALGNPEMKHSLFAGIAAPAIVVSVLAGAADGKKTRSEAGLHGQSVPIGLVSSAWAQETSSQPQIPSTMKKVIFDTVRSARPVEGNIDVVADGPKGRTAIEKVYISEKSTTAVQVPASAEAITIGGQRIPLATYGDTNVLLQLNPKASIEGDLFWALGAKRVFDIGSVDAVSVSPAPQPRN